MRGERSQKEGHTLHSPLTLITFGERQNPRVRGQTALLGPGRGGDWAGAGRRLERAVPHLSAGGDDICVFL